MKSTCKYCPSAEPTHEIPLNRLHSYFSGFMRVYGNMARQGKPNNLGGSFPAQHLKADENLLKKYPISAFYPAAEAVGSHSRFFLATKRVEDCTTTGVSPDICKQLDDLNSVSSDREAFATLSAGDIGWPDNTALPGGATCNENDFANYLKQLRFTVYQEAARYELIAQPASNVLVKEMHEFQKQTLISGIADYPSNAFVFSKNNSVMDLLKNPNVWSIGYFFGYDDTATHKIRLILFGIEPDQENPGSGKIAFAEDKTSDEKTINWSRTFREFSSPRP